MVKGMDTYAISAVGPHHERLPKRVRELIELIGLGETATLLEHHGGLPKYIPKKVTWSCRLLRTISRDSLARLSRRYGGESIELPKIDHIHRLIRNLEIIRRSENGDTRSELMAEYHLSRRQIANIRREYGEKRTGADNG